MTGSGPTPELARWSATDVHQSLGARRTGAAFWTASFNVIRGGISQYQDVAATPMAETG